MSIDSSPGVVLTIPRDAIRDQWCRSYGLRIPAADVGPGSQPYVDGSVAADAIVPIYSDAVTIGRGTTLRTSAGSWLQIIGEDEGVFKRPAVGSSGFVGVTTSAGGAFVLQGTVLLEPKSGLRYQVITTALYFTATPVPVQGIDTGPGTNMPVGTPLTFQAPPPGLSQSCAVIADSEGNGLIGGRDSDSDATYRALISERRANPPASGNDAEYQEAVQATPGISVQQVFTYPAAIGPGTMAYVFTLNPSVPGGERSPNNAEIASTLSYVTGLFPGDDGIFGAVLTDSSLAVALTVVWGVGAAGWKDAVQWPPFIAGDQVKVDVAIPPTSTLFRLTTGTSTATPQAGQNLGFLDPATRTFKLMRILSVAVVTPNLSWNITVDHSFGASDPSYVPVVGQSASPWSDSLNSLVPAVIAYFDGLGPGEMVSPLPDPGTRQRRQPPSPQSWPSLVDQRIVIGIYAVNNLVETVVPVAPTMPYTTPVGTLGTQAFLTVLGDLAVYAS